ncbi:hypothetical protein CH63R_10158 [Colletotrichum higginsianum IMI 349063]|uniref:Uncharacterized protein n=2 Tax=Colletotrichum higginsianum TaxID=80884 RepID=A0A1B7Y1Z9_COLHI|nr:uncharacterized protein CH63R_10158 [Colletotrichum higginsianum IMI 349063]OBR06038.1 hypothetical protein CH63R_10158 [Colletotrichum higginsianum IMI 349063]TIC97792.1 hypothetical protein CH35J_007020 [Colletotrichum higginsianum]
MATLSGVERIRAITDEDGMFKAFDTYPWNRDKAFMSGLEAILGDPNTENPQGSPSDLAIHARVFYYAQRIGVTIDFARYKDWLARRPDYTPPDILPEEYKSTSARDAATVSATAGSSGADPANEVPDLTSKLNNLSTGKDKDEPAADPAAPEPAPSWQSAAPKADLYVERNPASQADGPGQGGDEPAYPIGFAQMLEMIQKGIPIPGIRQIPDTVVRDASVKPFGKRAAPRKPWEKDITTAESSSVGVIESPSVVDHEFPPLDDVATPEVETAIKET